MHINVNLVLYTRFCLIYVSHPKRVCALNTVSLARFLVLRIDLFQHLSIISFENQTPFAIQIIIFVVDFFKFVNRRSSAPDEIVKMTNKIQYLPRWFDYM